LEEIEGRAAREGVGEIVHTVRANLEKPQGSTLPTQSNNWVLVANILHQSDPVSILTEAARIVTADGFVVVVEWDTVATPLGPPAEVRVPKAATKEMATRVGLELVREFKPSPYHYGLVLTKSTTDREKSRDDV